MPEREKRNIIREDALRLAHALRLVASAFFYADPAGTELTPAQRDAAFQAAKALAAHSNLKSLYDRN
ncbi:hypothetical protein [Paraburkholderia sp. MM6662-R1]|uniref:hypothetical protein n=1 Tax=Paraburkholderia sp. MM6662-R1 TaxID=2991066 RepID=UPI003D1A1D65